MPPEQVVHLGMERMIDESHLARCGQQFRPAGVVIEGSTSTGGGSGTTSERSGGGGGCRCRRLLHLLALVDAFVLLFRLLLAAALLLLAGRQLFVRVGRAEVLCFSAGRRSALARAADG